MKSYGGFCPVAKAAAVLAERWTPLIIRELGSGSHRFNELEQGLPGIPHSLLAQRLRSLVKAGVIERRIATDKQRPEYHLTAAGRELVSIVMSLGEWGQRWVNHTIGPRDVDPTLLMWDMHRRIHVERLPNRRIVVQFDFHGVKQQSIWLVLERPEPSVCLQDPGFDVDLWVTADTVTLHNVWLGRLEIGDALGDGRIEILGNPDLARAFPSWLALNVFAHIPSVGSLAGV